MSDTNEKYYRMTLRERAKALAGDMPWVTTRMTEHERNAFIDHLTEVFRAVEWQAQTELRDTILKAIKDAPGDLQQNQS